MDDSIENYAEEFMLYQKIEGELKEKYINIVELNNNKKSKVYIVKNTKDNKIYVKKDLTNYNIEVYNIIKNIDSNYIPRVYEVLEHSDILTIVEEYINGRTLSELLEEEKSLSEEKIIKYAINLCDALNELHNLKPPVIHRDIKLSNIIVTNDDFAKLIDFDVSRTYKSEEKRDTTMFGTHEYAAPEQFGFAQTDGRTDIYAIGVVMNLLSTREFPVMKKSEGALKEIIEKCIKMSPSDRYQSVEELKKALNQVKDTLSNNKKTFTNESNINLVKKKLTDSLSDKIKKEKLKYENIKYEKREKEKLRKEKLEKEEDLLKEKKDNREEKKQKVIKFDNLGNLNKQNKELNLNKKNSIRNIIPGFRTKKIWKMVISIALYLFLLTGLLVPNLQAKLLSLTFLAMWFLYVNFLNINEFLPLIKKDNNIFIRIFGYVIYTFVLFALWGIIAT